VDHPGPVASGCTVLMLLIAVAAVVGLVILLVDEP
jgi:hypothetical protein